MVSAKENNLCFPKYKIKNSCIEDKVVFCDEEREAR